MQAAEAYLRKDNHRVLYAISGPAERIAKQATAINAAMRQVRPYPSLSASQKREQLDQLQDQKNRMFDATAASLSLEISP